MAGFHKRAAALFERAFRFQLFDHGFERDAAIALYAKGLGDFAFAGFAALRAFEPFEQRFARGQSLRAGHVMRFLRHARLWQRPGAKERPVNRRSGPRFPQALWQ